MLLGYTISCTDTCDKLLGDDLNRVKLSYCERFKCIYDLEITLPKYIVPNFKTDFFCTADGFTIASERVKIFCERNRYKQIEFISLLGSDGYYWFKPNRKVRYDHKRRGVLFKNYLDKCEIFEEIVGAEPVCLKETFPLKDGIYRTDLSFGYKPKDPLICMGVSTMKKIKQAKLTGIHFIEILDEYKFLPPTTLTDEFWDSF